MAEWPPDPSVDVVLYGTGKTRAVPSEEPFTAPAGELLNGFQQLHEIPNTRAKEEPRMRLSNARLEETTLQTPCSCVLLPALCLDSPWSLEAENKPRKYRCGM